MAESLPYQDPLPVLAQGRSELMNATSLSLVVHRGVAIGFL
jgi:hypothetical protein